MAGCVPMELKGVTVKEFTLTEEGDVKLAFAEMGVVDREDDYTFPDAFPWGKALPISHFNHGSWPERGGHPPVGLAAIEPHDSFAVAAGKFFMDTTHGRDAYHTVKGMKDIQEWSYGYKVLERAKPPEGVTARRGLKKLDPYEVSPVLVGAGHSTHTMDIKGLLESDLLGLEDDEAIQTLLKGGPLASLPFAEMSARVLRDVEDFTARAAAIADMRVKEGRAISAARLAELTDSRGRLAEAIGAIDKVIAEGTPKIPDSEDEQAKSLRAARVRSRLAMASLDLAIN